MSQEPTTVRRAVQLLMVLVGLAGIAAVLTVVLHDELLASWSADHPVDSSIKEPAFAPVAIVLFLVFAGLAWVLVPFFRAGANWARHSISLMVIGLVLATLAGLRSDPPVAFDVVAVASLLVDAALLVLLWHPRTTAFLRESSTPAPTAV